MFFKKREPPTSAQTGVGVQKFCCSLGWGDCRAWAQVDLSQGDRRGDWGCSSALDFQNKTLVMTLLLLQPSSPGRICVLDALA